MADIGSEGAGDVLSGDWAREAKSGRPAFSIVTVVLNDREGLKRTANSIMGQTFRDFEWRIVDGGSRDGTREFAGEAAKQSGMVHVSSGPDKGLYDAMNKGLRAARGAYLLFLNAGDEFASTSVLGDLAGVLDEPYDIVFGSSIMRFGSRDLLRRAKPPSYLWHGQPGMHQGTLYRTDFHRRFEYSTELRVTADYECLARMAAAGAHMTTASVLVNINDIQAESVSMKNRNVTMGECYRTQRDVLHSPFWRRAVSYARRWMNWTLSDLILTFSAKSPRR